MKLLIAHGSFLLIYYCPCNIYLAYPAISLVTGGTKVSEPSYPHRSNSINSNNSIAHTYKAKIKISNIPRGRAKIAITQGKQV